MVLNGSGGITGGAADHSAALVPPPGQGQIDLASGFGEDDRASSTSSIWGSGDSRASCSRSCPSRVRRRSRSRHGARSGPCVAHG